MKTRDRILDKATELFNESGTAPVSTNHIAEALGISPGNLYYHFRNKEEIIRAVMERLFALWDEVFSIPSDRTPTLEDLRRLIQINFATLWDYRFVYRELIALLRRDPELQRRYTEIRQRGFDGFQELFDAFVAAGVLARPAEPATVTKLAELCWLVSEFWVPSLEVSGQTVDQQRMLHGIELMMQVLEPYLAEPQRGSLEEQ